MSRWTEKYENHPFQGIWSQILELSEEIEVDDDTVVTSVEELARLKKTIIFIDGLLKACDPELIPGSTWDNFQNQSSSCLQQLKNYQDNRNTAHLTNANNHVDNLLTYVRPYQVSSGTAAKSASAAFSAYARAVKSSLTSFQAEAKSVLEELDSLHSQANANAKETDNIKARIRELEQQYFDDSDEDGLETKIGKLEESLEVNYEKIQRYKTELIDGDSESESISVEIKKALESATNNSKAIKDLLAGAKTKLTDFESYHIDVFGSPNEEGELEGGLKNEIHAREEHLDRFKEKQEERYKALNDEIESLLPGATTAGLATAYHDLKESFDKPVQNYSKLFYASIAALMLVALISITQEAGWLYIKFVDTSNLSALFSNILFKLPVVIPALWLALFSLKRRSEMQRLQQEYAHKEALSKSYQNFKMQIDALSQSDPQLMTKLLSSAIDAVSNNASDTLDKKHGDKTPAHVSIDGFISSVEKLKKLIG